jgi:hypothetical protein
MRIAEPVSRNRGEYITATFACPEPRAEEEYVDRFGRNMARMYGSKVETTLELDASALADSALLIDLVLEATQDPLGVAGWREIAHTVGWRSGRISGKTGLPIQPQMAYASVDKYAHSRVRYNLSRRANVGVSVEAADQEFTGDRHHSIAYVAGAQASNTGGDLSWSHTVASGTDRALFVILNSWNSDTTPGSHTATFNGDAMSLIISNEMSNSGNAFNLTRMTGFGLAAPDVGTLTVATSASGAEDENSGTSNDYAGVDQTTPYNGPQTAHTVNANTISDTVTTGATGDVVLGGCRWFDAGATTITVGTDQTKRAELTSLSVDSVTTSDEPGGASITHSYDFNQMTVDPNMICWNIKASAASGVTATVASLLDEVTASLNAQQRDLVTIQSTTDEVQASLNASMHPLLTIASTVDEVVASLNAQQVDLVTVASTIDEVTASLNFVQVDLVTINSTVDETTASLNVSMHAQVTIVSTLDEVAASLAISQVDLVTIAALLDEVAASLSADMHPLITIASTLDEVAASLNVDQASLENTITIASVLDEATASLDVAMHPLVTIASLLDEVNASLNIEQSTPVTMTIASVLDEINASLNAEQRDLVTINSTLDEVTASLTLEQVYLLTIASVLDETTASLAASQIDFLTIVSVLDELRFSGQLVVAVAGGTTIIRSIDLIGRKGNPDLIGRESDPSLIGRESNPDMEGRV